VALPALSPRHGIRSSGRWTCGRYRSAIEWMWMAASCSIGRLPNAPRQGGQRLARSCFACAPPPPPPVGRRRPARAVAQHRPSSKPFSLRKRSYCRTLIEASPSKHWLHSATDSEGCLLHPAANPPNRTLGVFLQLERRFEEFRTSAAAPPSLASTLSAPRLAGAAQRTSTLRALRSRPY
jgi:hypothetical protein